MKSLNKKFITAFLAIFLVTVMSATVLCGIYAGYSVSSSGTIVATVKYPHIYLGLSGGSANVVVPGGDIILPNATTVTLEKGTTPFYVFIKIDKTEDFDSYMWFTLDGWSKVQGVENVYFRMQSSVVENDEGVTFNVFKDNLICVDESLTRSQIAEMTEQKLNVTAYAVQTYGQYLNAADAWSQLGIN